MTEHPVLAITGHRPDKLGGYTQPNSFSTAICEKLQESFLAIRPSLVLSGMALGVDQWAANVCINLGIPFDAVVPFQGQESTWPDSSISYYRYLLTKARRVEMLSPGPYSPALLHKRNRWMVDHADAVLAVWNGDMEGGTYRCLEYAWSAEPRKAVFKIELPKYFWDMAKAAETAMKQKRMDREERSRREAEERARRNAAFVRLIEDEEKRKAVKQSLKPPDVEQIGYGRFIDVGDEEP